MSKAGRVWFHAARVGVGRQDADVVTTERTRLNNSPMFLPRCCCVQVLGPAQLSGKPDATLANLFASAFAYYDTVVPPSTPTCTDPPTALASRVIVCSDRLALAWNSRVM